MQTFITGLAAVGTWVAIVVALFGDKLRSKLLPLRLEIELVDERGVITDQYRAWKDEHGQATTWLQGPDTTTLSFEIGRGYQWPMKCRS